jgi:hypothetical protein
MSNIKKLYIVKIYGIYLQLTECLYSNLNNNV